MCNFSEPGFLKFIYGARGSFVTWGAWYPSGESEAGRLVAAIWATAGGAGGWDIGILTFQEILSLLDWEEDQQGEYEVAAVAVYHVIGWQLQGHQTDHQDMAFQNLWLVGCTRTAVFLVKMCFFKL